MRNLRGEGGGSSRSALKAAEACSVLYQPQPCQITSASLPAPSLRLSTYGPPHTQPNAPTQKRRLCTGPENAFTGSPISWRKPESSSSMNVKRQACLLVQSFTRQPVTRGFHHSFCWFPPSRHILLSYLSFALSCSIMRDPVQLAVVLFNKTRAKLSRGGVH